MIPFIYGEIIQYVINHVLFIQLKIILRNLIQNAESQNSIPGGSCQPLL